MLYGDAVGLQHEFEKIKSVTLKLASFSAQYKSTVTPDNPPTTQFSCFPVKLFKMTVYILQVVVYFKHCTYTNVSVVLHEIDFLEAKLLIRSTSPIPTCYAATTIRSTLFAQLSATSIRKRATPPC